jgi:PAS domain S-box-containing protein
MSGHAGNSHLPPPVDADIGTATAGRCTFTPSARPFEWPPLSIRPGEAPATETCPFAAPLDERVRFEALLADLSAAFVNLPATEVDGRIDDALRKVVEFLSVERSSFAEVLDADRAVRLSHTYVKPGFPAFPPSILDDQLPWFSAMIRRGEVLRLERLPDDLPEEATREREYCIRSGIRSQLTIPLAVGGSVRFAIGCASFRAPQPWPEELVQRLRLLGEVFANALERRRADEELRRRERHYRDLIESTRAVPWEADPVTFRTSYISPQVTTLLGFPDSAWYLDGFWESRIHPDDRGMVLRGMGDAVRHCRDREVEYRLVAADGRTVWVHDLLTVQSEGGVATSLRGVMIDITARKGAENEASLLREELARASRLTLLGELAAAIAHEVNQPLCAIVSNAETTQGYLAEETADLGEVRDALQDIVADGRRASEIIRRIRALLRTRQTERAPFGPADAVREVAVLLRQKMTRDSITLTLDLAADLPPALGDRVQVQQVILNLISNAAEALQASPADRRRLSVSAARTGDVVAVSVQDSGPGISPDLLDRVFDAFFTTKADGTGIGLSISRTIIVAHGGRIWAEPAAGGGAVFRFTLPIQKG